MSTDVIRFTPNRSFSREALRYYLTITLPFMILTFIAAYAIRAFEKRHSKAKRETFRSDLEARELGLQ